MNTETAVIFENVTKFYNSYNLLTAGLKNFLFRFPKSLNNFRKKITVLENISLKITKGESVGIIGRNGAGKSTMLGLIAGTLKPNSGRVIVKQRVSPLLELGAGFHPDLNGRENIILNGVLLGLRRKEVIKKLDQIIEFSELNEFVDYPLRTYSSGMVARLGFSIVAHLEPELLLIDEILAVGDVNFQKKCLDKLNAFKKKSVTIILVSHSIQQVEQICDRAIWIEHCKVQEDGEVKRVCERYLKRV